jgi:hypothetical protein
LGTPSRGLLGAVEVLEQADQRRQDAARLLAVEGIQQVAQRVGRLDLHGSPPLSNKCA